MSSSKLLSAIAVAAAMIGAPQVAALPLVGAPELGTPGYTQTFTATGNCVLDWDNSGYQAPGLVVRDCEPFQFFVAVADDYVVGQSYFSIGGNGGVFGINIGNGWSYQVAHPSWAASGTINPDGTGSLWFMNSGFAVRTGYVPDYQWPWNHHYPFNQNWAWVLFAENGDGQTWFGDSFVWNVRALPEPGTLGLLLLGVGMLWRRRTVA
jgi:hypothetical protein